MPGSNDVKPDSPKLNDFRLHGVPVFSLMKFLWYSLALVVLFY